MEQVAQNHGLTIGAMRTHDHLENLVPPKSYREFYDFPKKCGWKVTDDGKLIPLEGIKTVELDIFIRAWLFFGLISTVVQKDNRPVLALGELRDTGYLSTTHLHAAIAKWTEWESQRGERSRFQLVQVGWVLDMARRVIQKLSEPCDAVHYVGGDTDSLYTNDGNEIYDPLDIDDKCMLVLMCLGETLSAAKARIVKLNELDTTGWHGDDHAGWGPPRHVFTLMKRKDGWCPRAVEILRGQVGSNATMLVAAYQAYKDSNRITEEHNRRKCTPQECRVTAEKLHTEYCTEQRRPFCQPRGPLEADIISVLDRSENYIPLLSISKDRGDFKFKVIAFNPDDSKDKRKFIAISHVWSDGWGNAEKNELNGCQLGYIRRQISRATEDHETPFWMDTLVIPVAEKHKEFRRKAIRQIFDVFAHSSCTIVLDNGISGMDPGGPNQPAEVAMKIISSVWMRRLWTLQEAFLSREILIPFKEESRHDHTLKGFDDIEMNLQETVVNSESGITGMIKIQLSSMIMGDVRSRIVRGEKQRDKKKRSGDKFFTKDVAAEVADAYRAARWRTTGKPEHEVLALATLLQLDTTDTEIEKAGLDAPGKTNELADNEKLDNLVVEFWKEWHKQYKGAIPSGMIFLPGAKVSHQGYGWAPRTWLSVHPMDYPDPLNFWNGPTDLSDSKGLGVCYPGFLLHPSSPGCRASILTGTDPFKFPVDRGLSEWYAFQRLKDPGASETSETDRLVEEDDIRLAIILSGSMPRESRKEIALLVEIVDRERSGNSETLDRKAVDYLALIICRVLIWREHTYPSPADRHDFKTGSTGPQTIKHTYPSTADRHDFKTASTGPQTIKHICLGETLSATQQWWVDRPYQKVSKQQMSIVSAATLGVSKAKRIFMGFMGKK